MSIGPGGLSRTKGENMQLKPGVIAYLGASSSPDRIIITGVNDSFITFRKYPFTKDQRIQRAIGEDLIYKGSSTWLKTYGSRWPGAAKPIKDLLAGKPVKPVNVSKWLKDQERLQVLVRPVPDADWSKTRSKDPWYAAEQYGGVGGLDSKESPTGMDYEISTNRGTLDNEIKKDKRFKVIKVTKRSGSVLAAGRVSASMHRFLTLAYVSVGETVEGKNTRIHRFRGSVRVTDLTNAGKRGKKCRQFALYDIDFATKNPAVEKNLNKFLDSIQKLSYDQALKWAKMIAKDSEVRGRDPKNKSPGMAAKVEETEHKGIDVMPAGFKPFQIDGKHVYIRADWEGFSIRDKGDRYNEPTCIQRGKKSVKQFYRWLKDNQSRVKSMTFSDIRKELTKNKIDYHQYCAMD